MSIKFATRFLYPKKKKLWIKEEFRENRCSENQISVKSEGEMLPYFYFILFYFAIWIKFCTGGVHKNVSSDRVSVVQMCAVKDTLYSHASLNDGDTF